MSIQLKPKARGVKHLDLNVWAQDFVAQLHYYSGALCTVGPVDNPELPWSLTKKQAASAARKIKMGFLSKSPFARQCRHRMKTRRPDMAVVGRIRIKFVEALVAWLEACGGYEAH